MKKREFNKLINSVRVKVKGKPIPELCLEKLKALSLGVRQAMGYFVIRNNGPVLVELVEGLDESWLNAMGYLYTTRSQARPELTFRHKGENKIR